MTARFFWTDDGHATGRGLLIVGLSAAGLWLLMFFVLPMRAGG